MKVAIFSPYGAARPESGLQYVIARHLLLRDVEVTQIRCNGALSACDRDLIEPQGREFRSCIRCMGESKRLAEWAGIPTADLSRFIGAADVAESREMVMTRSAVELLAAEYEGKVIAELCGDDLARRLGSGPGEHLQKRHEEAVRHVVLSVIRAATALRSYARIHQPDVLFLARGDDMLIRAAQSGFRGASARRATFDWIPARHAVVIEDSRSGETMESSLVFDDLPSMRTDVASWPAEIVRQLEAVETFLGLNEAQLTLPLATVNS